MEFICEKDLLVKNVHNATRAILPKSVEGILDCLLIKAAYDNLEITGYNLEFGITNNTKAEIITEGKTIISAKLFLEIIKKMPEDKIHVALEDSKCIIRSGKTEYFIMAGNCDDYPELPQITEGEEIVIEAEKLQSMISQTIFAVAVMDSKPVFTGSMFDIEGGKINLVSTDGSRIAIRTEEISNDNKYAFIVPGKALSELEKLIDDQTENVTVKLDKEHVLFTLDNCVIISRLLEGDFLNYRQCIPNSNSTFVKISRSELIQSIERTSLIISDRIKSPIRMKFAEGRLAISCSTAIGKSYDEIPCDMEGNDIEIGFNSKFMLDVLRAADTDQILLKLNGNTFPMCVTPIDTEEFLFLVLPTRI